MKYRLTASCTQFGHPNFSVELYESLSRLSSDDLSDLLEADKRSVLFEQGAYSQWRLIADQTPCIVQELSANGVPLDPAQEAKPFLLEFGFVQFSAVISHPLTGKKQKLVSKYCPALNSADTDNIKSMVDQLLQIREPSLQRWLDWPSQYPDQEPRPSSQRQEKYSMLTGSFQASAADVPWNPSSVPQILETYRKHCAYFALKAEFTVQKHAIPAPFYRVKQIGRESMGWTVRNGRLRQIPSDVNQGIKIGAHQYMPSETLTEASLHDRHIYENLVIVGFLDTIRRKLLEHKFLGQKSQGNEGFHLLQLILYPEASYAEDSLEELEALRRQYIHALHLEERRISPVNSLPRQTKRFLEILPYRDLYHCISEWFQHSATLKVGNGAIFKGRLADVLYEYFCWLQLLRLFQRNGYQKQAPSERTSYGGLRPLPPFSNIIHLKKPGDPTQITLYFDPWIPCLDRRHTEDHGITLRRISRASAHDYAGYSPDFLIKVERAGKQPRYAILDAKFRSMKALFSASDPDLCPMEDALYKYYLDISEKNHATRPISMVWLLQGRMLSGSEEERPLFAKRVSGSHPDVELPHFPSDYFGKLSWGAHSLNSQNTSEWSVSFWADFKQNMLL